jgi:putative spermidine/putrescine transport system substrate-binding protein
MTRKTMTALVLAIAVAAIAVAAATASARSARPAWATAPGGGEGKLTMVAWEGYAEDSWVKPFEKATGCQVQAKYAGSSNEMVQLMGSGANYDVVSASGDATLRLIYGKLVRQVNVAQIAGWKNFLAGLQSPPHNTVAGKHYGVSWLWGPNVLMWNSAKYKGPTNSWSVIYNPANKGKITIPDNPIQIADAAVYLRSAKPSLGIKDPYELTKPQFDAAVSLLKQQRPLVKKYWVLATDEIDAFRNGGATLGAAWPLVPYQLSQKGFPVRSTIPREGATGWADTWMIGTKAADPNCALMWLKYTSTPKVQAQAAKFTSYTPANRLSCAILGTKLCTAFKANAPASYFKSIAFWKTPIAACGNGKNTCMSYTAWNQAWTSIRG